MGLLTLVGALLTSCRSNFVPRGCGVARANRLNQRAKIFSGFGGSRPANGSVREAETAPSA